MNRRTVLTGSAFATVVGVAGSTVGWEAAHAVDRGDNRCARPVEGLVGAVSLDTVWRVRTDRREVALTFDDGPDPKWTPHVLQLLRRHRAHATFFMVGERVRRHPELARRVIAEGHEIGNHSWTHVRLDHCDRTEARDQVRRADGAIAAVTGTTPTLFRPPWGLIDPVGMLAAAEAGHRVVLWSSLIRGRTPQSDLQRTVAHTTPGAIILGHDGGPTPRAELMTAFDALLGKLTADNYRFVTVSRLLAA